MPRTEEEERPGLAKYIDESLYRFPDIALAEATKELHRIGEVTAEMIALGRRAVIKGDIVAMQRVLELEDELIDPLCATLDSYLNELLQEDAVYFELLRNLERISDHAENLGVSVLRA